MVGREALGAFVRGLGPHVGSLGPYVGCLGAYVAGLGPLLGPMLADQGAALNPLKYISFGIGSLMITPKILNKEILSKK